jgi:uncharacterized protein (UPF0147 family)
LEEIVQKIMNRRGASGILVLGLLGSMFIAITVAVGIHIGSENDTLVSLARSQEGGTRLTFIAQCMNADFYNNLLQNRLEEDVIEFLRSTEHIIDPARSFRENLGQELQSHMSQSASSIVSGDAGRVYAAAYDEVPGISCTPVEIAGASASVSIRQREDGVLELSSWTVGQRVKCDDSDADSSLVINLEARNYQLSTRAVAIHDRAVEEILSIKGLLDVTYGGVRYGNWRLHDYDGVKTDILNGPSGWLNAVSGNIALRPRSDSDGIVVEPRDFSVVRDSNLGNYQAEDIQFVCYGNGGNYLETGQGGQTCRPDGLSLKIENKTTGARMSGASVPEGAVELKFDDVTTTEVSVTWTLDGVSIDLPGLSPLGSLLGDVLDRLFNTDQIGGYVTYDGVTHLCNQFMGKPNSAVIRGRITEMNSDYIPSGSASSIPFNFRSSQISGIDTNRMKNEFDCSGNNAKRILGENVLLLISKGGQEFKLNIEGAPGDPKIKETDVQDLVNSIAQNPMYSVIGEDLREVTIRVQLAGQAPIEKTGDVPRASEDAAQALYELNNPLGAAVGGSGGIFAAVTGSSNPAVRATNVVSNLQDLSSALSSEGLGEAAEAIARTSSSVCKMMGVGNYVSLGEYDKALLALCGIGNLYDMSNARTICNLAGLYQAIDSGSVQGVLSVLNRMSDELGIPRDLITAATIVEAVRSGDAEAVLRAAATAAMLQGYEELARFYSGAAAVIQGLENGQALTAISGFFGLIGEQDMANFFGGAASLQAALDSGDGMAAVGAVSQMAASLGYDGLATLTGAVASAKDVVDLVANLDGLKEACKDGIPWDLLCTVPAVGGGICRDPHPLITSCKFSYGLPTFNLELLCDDMISEFGFKIDCSCVYSCPNFPYTLISQQGWAVNINNLYMLLDDAELAGLRHVVGAAGLIYALTQADADLMQYCQLDP